MKFIDAYMSTLNNEIVDKATSPQSISSPY